VVKSKCVRSNVNNENLKRQIPKLNVQESGRRKFLGGGTKFKCKKSITRGDGPERDIPKTNETLSKHKKHCGDKLEPGTK
jgi:hypothetical protein